MPEQNLLKLADSARVAMQAGQLAEAQALVETFLETEGTDRRWGLAFLDTVLGRLHGESGDEVERLELAARRQRLQDELLAGDEDDESWVHRWERARLLNNRAWTVIQHGGSREDQEAALFDIERSLAFWPYFLSHIDTRSRLQLGLGHDEEVYRSVRWVEALQPGWPDFRDILASEAYRSWLDEHTYDTLEMPAGHATTREVVPPLALEFRSPPDARLNGAERRHLRSIRIGPTEWHRARNAALIGLLLDIEAPLETILTLPPHHADLSLGSIQLGEQAQRPSEATLEKLRHWMLWGANNHPSVFDSHPPPGIRQFLFHRWSLDPLTVARVEELLAEIGERTGIQGLCSWRLQRLLFERFHCGVIGEAERRRTLRRAPAADARAVQNETVATVMRWFSRGEDTYIPFTYEVEGVAYGFVYLTPYDEVHRAFGNHPAEWYDDLLFGEVFRVGFDPDDPRDHRVLDPRFETLNGQVMFVGTADRYVNGPGDVDLYA
jgi:hypothetical protein